MNYFNAQRSKVVGCLIRVENRMLLLKRAYVKKYPGYWGVPGGKVELNESLMDTVTREVLEETELSLTADNLKLFSTYNVNINDDRFDYSLFIHIRNTFPKVCLNKKEHLRHEWVTLKQASRLLLIPTMQGILNEVESTLFGNKKNVFKGAESLSEGYFRA